jgi:hypothetical protein
MRRLWLLRILALSAALSVSAETSAKTSREEWRFIFTMASTDWDVRKGTALLERSSSSIAGSFVDTAGVQYKLNVKIAGHRVTGRVVILESDNGIFDMTGTYTRRTVAAKPCVWQAIQLYDGFHFFSLLRTEDTCQP